MKGKSSLHDAPSAMHAHAFTRNGMLQVGDVVVLGTALFIINATSMSGRTGLLNCSGSLATLVGGVTVVPLVSSATVHPEIRRLD